MWSSPIARMPKSAMAMTANNTLERTVDYRGLHPKRQQVVGWLCVRQAASWSAAQLGR